MGKISMKESSIRDLVSSGNLGKRIGYCTDEVYNRGVDDVAVAAMALQHIVITVEERLIQEIYSRSKDGGWCRENATRYRADIKG